MGSAHGVYIETEESNSDITFETGEGTTITSTDGRGVLLRTSGSNILAGNTINGTVGNTAEVGGVGIFTGFEADANDGGSATVHVGKTGLVQGSGGGLLASAEDGGSVTITVDGTVNQTSLSAIPVSNLGLGQIVPFGVAGVVTGSGTAAVTANAGSTVDQNGNNTLLNGPNGTGGFGMLALNSGTGNATVTANGLVNSTGIGVAAITLNGGNATANIGGDVDVDSLNGGGSIIGSLLSLVLPPDIDAVLPDFTGTIGGLALSNGGDATINFSGNVLGNTPDIGLASIVIGGGVGDNAEIKLDPSDPTPPVDPSNVNANVIGLAAINVGAGNILVDNKGTDVQSDGAGTLALKLGAGDALGGDSVVVNNVGSVSKMIGEAGPGVAIIAFDTTATAVNNVNVLNDQGATISGGQAGPFGVLGAGIGILADGAANIVNDNESLITNKNGISGLAMSAGTGGNIAVTNDRKSEVEGTVILGSLGGNVTFTNDRESTWTSDGISLLGALTGVSKDVTVNNKGGSTIKVDNGVLATLASNNATINNESGFGWGDPRSSITFGGVSANLMVAGNDAVINNTNADFLFDGIFTGNIMDAGNNAQINNTWYGSFRFNSAINGNLMFAGNDAAITNQYGSLMEFAGLINGNYMNAENDARITNSGYSTFRMLGLANGNVMVADEDTEIVNSNYSSFTMAGFVNSGIMIADAGGVGDPPDGIGNARIRNTNNSEMNFVDFVGTNTITAPQEVSFENDETSEMNFIGLLNQFQINAGYAYFDNDGQVNVSGNTAFFGLDDFNNNGTVNMIDDDPEDYLFLSGNYNANSELAINAELTPGGEADVLNVRGNVTGVTHLTVNDLDSGPGQYDPEGVLFAMVGGSTDTSNFTTGGGIDKGLFRYDAYLRVDDPNIFPGDDGWYLASTLDQEAYEFPSMMSGAQALWNASTGTWLDRTADLRVALGDGAIDPSCAKDCIPEQGNVTPGVWMKALAGTQSRDGNNTSSPPSGLLGASYDYDTSFDQNFWGFMAGADGGKEWVTGSGQNAAWLAGIMGGYLNSGLDYDNSSTNVDYEAFSVGLYTTYMQGGFFLDATLKADIGTMDYDSNLGGGNTDDFSSSFTSIGGLIDTGYRFGLGSHGFFEPLATLSYVSTSMDDGEVLGTDVTFDDGESLQGRLGARVGGTIDSDSMKSELFVEASVWNEFLGGYDAHLGSNGYDVGTDLDTGGVYGEVAGGVNVFGSDGHWNGFLTGGVQFGEDFTGYNGNVGMRYSW